MTIRHINHSAPFFADNQLDQRCSKALILISAIALIVSAVAIAFFSRVSSLQWTLGPLAVVGAFSAVSLITLTIRQLKQKPEPAPPAPQSIAAEPAEKIEADVVTPPPPTPPATPSSPEEEFFDFPITTGRDLGIPFALGFAEIATPQDALNYLTQKIFPQLEIVQFALFDTILDLYGRCYGTGGSWLTDGTESKKKQCRAAAEKLRGTLTTKLQDPDFFIWVAMDSAYITGTQNKQELNQFRVGEKTAEEVISLLNNRAREFLPFYKESDELIALIESWCNCLADRGAGFNVNVKDVRDHFVKSYLAKEEKDRAKLAWFFCQLIFDRLDADGLSTWIEMINQATYPENIVDAPVAKELDSIPEYTLQDTFTAMKLSEGIDPIIENSPLTEIKDILMEQARPLVTPIACAIKPGTKFNKLMKPIVKQIHLINRYQSNVHKLSGELISLAKPILAKHK